jgi:hypothetical protein
MFYNKQVFGTLLRNNGNNSFKAMPPTGNPHIDKKVRVVAKKPK